MIKKFLLICLISNLIVVFCEDTKLEWMVNRNIDDFIETAINVEKEYYSDYPISYGIKKNSYGVKKDTELYLPFDETTLVDETGKYELSYSNYFISDNKKVINKAAYFINEDNRVELVGKPNSFFRPGINLTSFSISYWIYPVTTSHNEIIIKIGGQYYNKKKENIEDQSIINKIEDGRLIWEFNNTFVLGEKYIEQLTLKSYYRIIPDKWTQVTMTYDSFTGVIRVYINGVESSIAIATIDGTLNSSVYNLRYHPTNRCLIKIAQSFTGALDEFYIFNKLNNYHNDKYDINGGEIVSSVILLNRSGVYIKKIIPNDILPDNSEIRYFYRYSDKPFFYDSKNGQDTGWRLLGMENLESKLIKYIQFKIVFLPGTNNAVSPQFRGITIDMKKNIPPSKPLGVKIMALDGKVKLKWKKNSEIDVKGYKIYYGTKSGYYFGNIIDPKSSPIFVSKEADFEGQGIEITELNNNTIYYFAVTAYDDDDTTNESEFSQEVFCRPIENYTYSN